MIDIRRILCPVDFSTRTSARRALDYALSPAVDLMFFGSTTQHVVRQATCPVLTIKAL